MKNCEFKLNKKNRMKILFITTFAITLIIIPNLLVINQRNLRFSIDEKNTDEIITPELPRESSVYYSDTSGLAMGVFVSGNYAYLANGESGLAVIDISDPTNPGPPVYEATAGWAQDVYISGDYAYVTHTAEAGPGLAVIDISDPTNPGPPVYEDTTDYPYGIYVSGDYAYVAASGSGLAVIDISNPTNPGTPIYKNMPGDSSNVYISGDYAYVADRDSGLAVIDISDPINPGSMVYEATSGEAWSVYVSGDYAYVTTDWTGLAVIDISDPTNPGTPVYEGVSSRAVEIYVSGDHAYVADYNQGLTVIDISDPTNPKTPVYEDLNGHAHDVYIDGDYAYVAAGAWGLAVIEISEPIDPETPVYEDTTWARDVDVSGDYAYVADWNSGLAVIDISDPTNPGTPVYEDTTGWANSVYISGDYAYVTADVSGLAVISISDPTNPGIPIYEDTGGNARGVYVSGDYAYVAHIFGPGLAVIDISDPTNPGVVATESTTGVGWDVYVSGDYAYLANGESGLAVIDISNPTNPGTPVYENTNGRAYDVHVSGDYAYVADGSTGLAVIDISDPTNPGPTFYEDTNGSAVGVFVSGDYAYIADDTQGLAVIDISDPTNPGTPIYEDTSGFADDVYISGDYAYVAALGSGLAVIQVRKRYDMTDPIITDKPSDFTVEFGYTGVSISWTATDPNPNTYTIKLQGVGIVAGPSAWSNGTAITYNVPDGLAVGGYIYTANFTDDNGLFDTDTVIMTVEDTTDPMITDAPSDFNVESSYTGVSISWTATDPHPNTYTIELQGVGIVAGPSAWSNGTKITYNVPDGLAVGDYIYTTNFTDNYDNFVAHTVTMTVEIATDPIIEYAPSDFSVEYGYSGVNISWMATDPHPSTYTIELQGVGIVAGPSAWSNGTTITYNVPDGLAVGDYIYIVNFTDDYGNFATDTVIMTVQVTTNPIITDAPNNFTVEYGYTGVNVSWTATDPHPNTYTIELQGVGIVAGPTAWSSGTVITYHVPDGLAVGEYIYTVNFTDDYDNFATHTVTMTVQVTTDPIITDSPSDFSVVSGYTGVSISWTATDPHPNTYTIELQGVGIVIGPSAWSNGTIITYNVPDGLTLGEYIYTVNFTDDYGNFLTHTVTMTVREVTTRIPLELIILTSAIGGGAVIGVATLLLIKRRRKRIE